MRRGIPGHGCPPIERDTATTESPYDSPSLVQSQDTSCSPIIIIIITRTKVN